MLATAIPFHKNIFLFVEVKNKKLGLSNSFRANICILLKIKEHASMDLLGSLN